MKRIIFALMSLLIVGTALAQEQATPAVPFTTPAPLVIVTPEPDDARAAACAAFTLPDFAPYVVRPGDQLAGLIANTGAMTVTQLATLNCLDDPNALPVGAVIWLPAAPAVESAVPEATAEATVDAAAAPTAAIERFTTSGATILNTEAVTFAWSASGSRAYFYLCPVQDCLRPRNAQPLPLDGTLRFDGYNAAGTYRYRLEVAGLDGPATQDLSVEVTCAQDWLGGVGASPRCPQDPALTVFAVWQPFEGGVMLWFSDTQQIYVMTDDGQFRIYEDVYVEGQPDPADQPPSERFTPVRGFGQIWQALGGADSPLGWALTREVGYDAARQAAGRTSYTTYIQGPGGSVYAVTQLPGMEVGYWAQVAW